MRPPGSPPERTSEGSLFQANELVNPMAQELNRASFFLGWRRRSSLPVIARLIIEAGLMTGSAATNHLFRGPGNKPWNVSTSPNIWALAAERKSLLLVLNGEGAALNFHQPC